MGIPITTDDIKTIKPGQTIEIYYGYGDNKIVAPMTYGTDTGLDKTAANNYITVRDFVVGQGNSANVGGTLVSTALDTTNLLRIYSVQLGDQASGAGVAEVFVDKDDGGAAKLDIQVIDKTHNGVSLKEYADPVTADVTYLTRARTDDRQQIHAGSKFDAFLKYTSCGKITDGEIRFTVPAGFTAPQVNDSSAEGYVDLFFLDQDGDIDNNQVWDGQQINDNLNTAGYTGVIPAGSGQALANWNHLFPVLDNLGRPYADHRDTGGAVNYVDSKVNNGAPEGLELKRAVYDVEYGARLNDENKDLPASLGLPVVNGQTVTFRINKLVAGGVLALRYKASVAPVIRSVGTQAPVFAIHTRSVFGQGDFVAVNPLQAQSLTIDLLNGVGKEDAKPSGNVVVAPNTVPAGSTNTYTVTYSPYASLSKTVGNGDGSTYVDVGIPNIAGWNFPKDANNKIDPAKVKVSVAGGAVLFEDNKAADGDPDGVAVTIKQSAVPNNWVEIQLTTLEPGQ